MHLDDLPAADNAFLRACIFGDGWLAFDERNAGVALRIGYSVKQLLWLEWKAERINNILGKSLDIFGPYWMKSGDTSEKKYESYLYNVSDKKTFYALVRKVVCE